MRIISANDRLTGLANRILFESRLKLARARMRRNFRPFAVLYLDFDGFRAINDSLGHAAGDDLLRQFSHRLQSAFRPCDTLARFTGDDFAILIEDLVAEEDAKRAARKVIDFLAIPFQLSGHVITLHVSIGIASNAPGQALSAETLMQQADAAMHDAKLRSGSFYRTYPDLLTRLASASTEDEALIMAAE